MDIFIQLAQQSGVANLGIGNLVMFVVAGILIYLAITKEYEPLLLIPIGFGAILANLPLAQMARRVRESMAVIYDAGNQDRASPAPDLHGGGGPHGLPASPGEASDLPVGGSGPARDLRRRIWEPSISWVSPPGGGFHRHHRRCRRSHVHLPDHPSWLLTFWAPWP